MKYLIITADDLGLTKSINEGIAVSYRDGIVTAISVIPTGEALEDAVQVIKDLKLEEIGAHLSLTETRPLLKSSKFYQGRNKFFLDLFFGRIDLGGVYEELKAQIELLKKIGVRITHINSHEHLHMMPHILNILIRLAKEYDIPAIRYPRGDRPAKRFAVTEIYKSFILSYFSKKIETNMKNSGLLYTDYFLGLLDAGRLNENTIIEMLNNLKDGVTELVAHPGFLGPEVLEHYSWHKGSERELFALTDNRVKNAVNSKGIKLIKYRELLSLAG